MSPDGRLLAYSTDFTGSERFTLRVKDLVSGETAPDEIPGTFYGGAWSADGTTLFYVTVDDGLAALPGVAAPHRHARPPRTWSCTKSPTSGSGSGSG